MRLATLALAFGFALGCGAHYVSAAILSFRVTGMLEEKVAMSDGSAAEFVMGKGLTLDVTDKALVQQFRTLAKDGKLVELRFATAEGGKGYPTHQGAE